MISSDPRTQLEHIKRLSKYMYDNDDGEAVMYNLGSVIDEIVNLLELLVERDSQSQQGKSTGLDK